MVFLVNENSIRSPDRIQIKWNTLGMFEHFIFETYLVYIVYSKY